MSAEKVIVINLINSEDYQPLLVGTPQTQGMRSGRVYLKPGQACETHSTNSHEEQLVFLSGTGQAVIGEEQRPFEVGKNKICYIPPHTIHSIENTGTEPLIYIYCVTPIKD